MNKSNGNYILAIAIIVAGLLIGLGVYLGDSNTDTKKTEVPSEKNQKVGIILKPISENDHLLGNPNADLTLVEYSDTECPACKTFHSVMNQIINEYGKDGKVAWVYRHFPLTSIHKKAIPEAHALECATELGGKTIFWDFIDKIYETTTSNDGLDLEQLPIFAEELGINKEEFVECQESDKYAKKIEDSFNDALSAGAPGTPYNLLVTKSGDIYQIRGGAPYPMMKQIIDTVLTGIENGESYENINTKIQTIIGR